jgi:hypothetical protein
VLIVNLTVVLQLELELALLQLFPLGLTTTMMTMTQASLEAIHQVDLVEVLEDLAEARSPAVEQAEVFNTK